MSFGYDRDNYDEKCYELAEHFLGRQASERDLRLLAWAIQDAVGNFLGPQGQALGHSRSDSSPF